MYIIQKLLLILILSSCAAKKMRPVIYENKLNALKGESFFRSSNKDLSQVKHNKKTLALCHQGEFDKAIDNFKASLDTHKNNSHYWNEIGVCYLLKEEYSKAITYLEIALGIARTNKAKSVIFNNLGLINLKLTNYSEAIDYFKESSKAYNQSITPQYNLALTYSKLGLYQNSKKILTQLLKINSDDPDINYQIAHIYLIENNYLQAKNYFEKIQKEYLIRDDIVSNYALTLHYLGENEKAKELLELAPKKDKHFSEAQRKISSQQN